MPKWQIVGLLYCNAPARYLTTSRHNNRFSDEKIQPGLEQMTSEKTVNYIKWPDAYFISSAVQAGGAASVTQRLY